MEFNAHKPIYLQICDQFYERILSGELNANDRILSVRELGVEIGVNPNTIMRSYELMQNNGIIYNKRGIGYFITEEAKKLVLETMRKEFVEKEVPAFLKKLDLLDISLDELKAMRKSLKK